MHMNQCKNYNAKLMDVAIKLAHQIASTYQNTLHSGIGITEC